MHQPHEEILVEEMRALARRRYGPRPPGREPVEHQLVNVERMTNLLAIAQNPYHELVFGGLSTVQLMRICAYNLMESLNYREAGKLLLQIERIEQAQAARAARDLPPEMAEPHAMALLPEPEPADTYVLDLEAVPVEPPAPKAEDVYARSLSDRELARQFKAAQTCLEERAGTRPSNDWDPPDQV